MKFILTTEAKDDVKNAKEWYEEKQKGLGKRLTGIIRSEIKSLAKNPESYSFRYKDIRTLVLSVFPYMIHYRVDTTKNQIIILGVIHTSLNPKNWK